jgi:hypothetical protein
MRKQVRIRFLRSVAILAFGAGGRMVNTEVARTSQFSTFLSGEDEQESAKSESNKKPSELPTRSAQRRFWLAGRNGVRAVAIWERTFGALAALRFRTRAEPSIAAFRRKTFPGVTAASALIRTERARVSLIRMSTNPILVRTRVAIFFEAKLIEQSPHASKSSGVDDGQSSVNERE